LNNLYLTAEITTRNHTKHY